MNFRNFWVTVIFLLALFLSVSSISAEKIKYDPLNSIATLSSSQIIEALLFLQKPSIIDPSIDDASTVFSYFSKPVYQLGLRGERFATEVTPEGYLYTGAVELVFLGRDLRPLKQRIWTLLDGYLPCIQYSIGDGEIVYKVEAFQFWLAKELESPQINFIRFSVKNNSEKPTKAVLGVGCRYGIKDHRSPQMTQMKFNPFWKYEMEDNFVKRDGKLIYLWDELPSKKWATSGVKAKGEFYISERSKVGAIVEYDVELAGFEEKAFSFKLPHYPLDLSFLDELKKANYDEYLERMKDFWNGLLAQGMEIYVSEPKVVNASKAALVHNIMSQNFKGEGEIEQTVNRFQYNRYWLRDAAFHLRNYALWNYLDTAQKMARYSLRYQDESGNFLSQKGQLDGFGQTLWAFGEYLKLSQDREFALEILPNVKKAVRWFEEVTAKDKFGLMPATNALDNEWIIGHYTGHNIWATLGLGGAEVCARLAGDLEYADRVNEIREKFFNHFLEQLRIVAGKNKNIIPPGMDVPDGVDWGNLKILYPGYLIPANDSLVVNTFEHYRAHHYKEGIATYRSSLHHYLTERVAETELIRGNQERALSDFYSMLVHTGSCHQGFEWSIFPWTDRDYCLELPGFQHCNFPPHGWYAALYNTLLRNLFVREEKNSLHIFSALSPQWVKPGDKIVVKNANTYFGTLSLEAFSDSSGIELKISPHWRNPPDLIILHFPFYSRVNSVEVDGKRIDPKDGFIELSSQVRRVRINWEVDRSVDMGYQAFVEAYKKEYQRRWKIYKQLQRP